jgi:hypothetical protein
MNKLGYPRAPLLIGLILVPFAERNFQLSVQLSRGTYDFLTRPITMLILGVALLALVIPILAALRRRGRKATARAATMADVATMSLGDAFEIAEGAGDEAIEADRRPQEALAQAAFALFLLAWDLLFLFDTLFREKRLWELPLVAQAAIALTLAYLAYTSGRRWLRTRRPGDRSIRPGLPTLRSVGWLLAYPVLFASLGTVTASTLFTFGFVAGFAPSELSRTRLIVAFALAAVVFALLYGAFLRWLHIPLWEGWFI